MKECKMYEMVYENNTGEIVVIETYDNEKEATDDMYEACFGRMLGNGVCEQVCKAFMSGKLTVRQVI